MAKRIRSAFVFGLMIVSALLVPLPAAAANATPADVALDWNATAVDTVRSAGKLQAEGELYMGYVQAAVYDAVTAIEGGYQQYRIRLVAPKGASPEVAAAAAAHRVLVHYFPASEPSLDAKYDAYVSSFPDASAAAAGAEVGESAAAEVIAMRSADVRSGSGGYVFGSGPGVWTLPTPDNPATSPQTPWLRNIAPFMLRSPDQYRVEAPPDITSNTFETELNEVAAYGGATSTLRTDEMSVIARFWTANVINQYNLALRAVAMQRSLTIEDAVRLLAMGNMVVADAAIACWDSKYAYSFWRPVQAVRATIDPSWTPFLAPTPNHPDYPSAHGCLTSALGEVFAIVLGTDRIDVDIPGVNPATLKLDPAYTRHFDTVHELTQEIEDARVWAGYHFRGSVIEGVSLGRQVAQFDTERYFLPVGEDEQGDA